MTNNNGAPDNSLDFDPNADYLKEVQGEGAAVEASGEIPAVDPQFEAAAIASVAEATDPSPDPVAEAQVAELSDALGISIAGGETLAEALAAHSLVSTGLLGVADGLADTANTVMEDVVVPSHEADIGNAAAVTGVELAEAAAAAVPGIETQSNLNVDSAAESEAARIYADEQAQDRQKRVAAAQEYYRQQLTSSPRYKELYAKYVKPTQFIEGTMKIKERAPDPTFGKALRTEEAPHHFPGSKIIVFEKDGKVVRYALGRDQYGELQGSVFALMEKTTDANSRQSSWVNSPLATAAAAESDRFMVGPTNQLYRNDLEEMEAFLQARKIEI